MAVPKYYVVATKNVNLTGWRNLAKDHSSHEGHIRAIHPLIIRRDRLIMDTPKARNILKHMRGESMLRKADLFSSHK